MRWHWRLFVVLAAGFGGRAVRFDDCFAAMVEADIVVSSTGCPQTILRRADLAPAARSQPLSPSVAPAKPSMSHDAWQQATVRCRSSSVISTDWWPGVWPGVGSSSIEPSPRRDRSPS